MCHRCGHGADRRWRAGLDQRRTTVLAARGTICIRDSRAVSQYPAARDTLNDHATHTTLLGIGNAIFDVLVHTDENFLGRHGMAKGGMTLIDEARATAIYQRHGPGGGDVRRLGRQHHCRRRHSRRPRRLYRQGQG